MNSFRTQKLQRKGDSETFFDPSETVTLFHDNKSNRDIERLRLIYHDEPFTLTSYIIVTLIMVFMAWPHTNQFILTGWFISIIVVLSIRCLLTLSFQSSHEKNIRPEKWQQRLIISSFFTGLVIGSCGLISFLPGQHFLPLILTVGLITLASISITTLAIDKNIFTAFLIPALLPITTNTLLSGDRINAGIGLLIIIFSSALLLLSRHTRENIEKSLTIHYENTNLLNNLTASKIQLEKKNIELEQLATQDHLTNLANRRYGDKHLSNEWNTAIRYNRVISIAMIDIDQFKSYNDHYGHQMGDDCLHTIALALHQTISRPSDLALRYGGEEFMVILPDTDDAGAFRIIKRFQDVLDKVHTPHGYSTVSDHVTVSCGIASITPTRTDKSATLINQADIALYKAKFNGGNCTITF